MMTFKIHIGNTERGERRALLKDEFGVETQKLLLKMLPRCVQIRIFCSENSEQLVTRFKISGSFENV